MGESNHSEFSRQPLYILGNILGFIWHVIWAAIQIWVGILQILMGF